jgi:hypothetical protein
MFTKESASPMPFFFYFVQREKSARKMPLRGDVALRGTLDGVAGGRKKMRKKKREKKKKKKGKKTSEEDAIKW